jgi:gliding motility-associated-like protein
MKKLALLIIALASTFYVNAGCVDSSTVTVSPPPDPGTGCYFPGTTVTFCVTVYGYAQTSADWLCGIVPTFGPGWDTSTFLAVSTPTSVSGNGNWGWYSSCTSTNSGVTYGPGFFFDTAAGSTTGTQDGVPGNNYGDYCAALACSWVFCFSIQTDPLAMGATGTYAINAFGDDLAGSWGSSGCGTDSLVPATAYCITNCTVTIPTLTTTDVLCYGDSTGTANVIPSGGYPPYSYLWSNGDTTQTVTGLGAGLYYSVIVTDSVGCSKVVYFPIYQPTQINLNASVVQIGCSSNVGSITTNVNGGTSPYSYSWSNGSSNPSLTNLSAGTYTLTVTDSIGCTITNSYTIITVPPLSTNTTSSAATCGGANGTATVNILTGTPPYIYSWTPNVSSTSSATGLAAGTYIVSVADSNGCIVTDSIVVNASATFTLTAQSTQLNCSGAGGTASVVITGSSGPYTYLWNTGATTDSLTNLSSGVYTVTVTDINGCSLTANSTIQPYIPITLTPGSTIASCNTNNGTASVIATGGSGLYTYLWTPGGYTTPSISNLTPGVYTVTVTDANATTCTMSSTITVSQYPAVFISASADTTVCSLQAVSINTSVTGGTPTFNYLWSNGSITSSVNINPSSTTSYTVTVTDSSGCTAVSTSTVNIVQYPVISLTGNSTICSGSSIQLSATGGNSFSWAPSTGLSNIAISNPVAAPNANTNYIVTASNGNCSSVDSVFITVNPSPAAVITADSTSGAPPLTVQFNADTTGVSSYNWNFGDGATSISQNPSHIYTNTGTYIVVLTTLNSSGCLSSDTITVDVEISSSLIIYNVFAPDGSNIQNNNWHFEEHGINSISVDVYNRWGRKVYSWSGVNGKWNGLTSDGKKAPSGTYFYIVKAHAPDKDYNLRGSVELIREGK